MGLMAQAVHRLDKEAAGAMLDVCGQVGKRGGGGRWWWPVTISQSMQGGCAGGRGTQLVRVLASSPLSGCCDWLCAHAAYYMNPTSPSTARVATVSPAGFPIPYPKQACTRFPRPCPADCCCRPLRWHGHGRTEALRCNRSALRARGDSTACAAAAVPPAAVPWAQHVPVQQLPDHHTGPVGQGG